MGEQVDMMLEGLLCESCGVLFDDVDEDFVSPGYPRTCNGCVHGSKHPQPFHAAKERTP